MRLAILADVHSNLPALQAVLADVQRRDVDGIVVAGDLIGGAPQVVETVRLLRSCGSWMIRGNNDSYFVAYQAGDVPDGWRVNRQWAAMRWSYRQLDRETLDFMASLPEGCVVNLPGAAPIRVVHGSPRDPSESLVPDRDAVTLRLFNRAGLLASDRDPLALDLALAQIREPVLVCGHTHIPWQQERDGRLALNPGSVGAPINGDPRAQYALLTWEGHSWQAEYQVVAYDLDPVRAAFCQSGLLAEGGGFARACLLCIETGHNFPGHLVSYAHRLAVQAGFEGCQVVPDAIWEQAVATFDWDGATGGRGK
jgi:predicted phosphodiesterase